MKNSNLLISIITVVYNGEKFLEKTIKSVINQSYQNIEYIVIDGGSTDGTIDIIKKYKDRIDYWVSEKDDGIYDAMNKGLERASGDFVNFMNGGDTFYDKSVLEKIISFISMVDNNKIAYFGRAEVVSRYCSWFHPSKSIDKSDIDKWLEKNAPNHQALFFPKTFYDSERYDLNLTIFADADYKNRMKKQGRFKFMDLIVCKFEFGGVSSEFSSYRDVKIMMREALKMGFKDGELLHSIKRIAVYNIKYISRKLLKEETYLKIIEKIRN
jgi:putative colanic acid biosynthesis glycosyltransferase